MAKINTIKKVTATNDTIKKAIDTAIPAIKKQEIKYRAIMIDWTKTPKSFTKNKAGVIACILSAHYKKPISLFIEPLGFALLKNKGIATEANQIYVKNTDKQAESYLIEFAKCITGKGNTKTTKAYAHALVKMDSNDMDIASKAYYKACGLSSPVDLLKELAKGVKSLASKQA